MNKFPRKYLNSKEEGYYIMLEAALAYINGETEEGGVKLNNQKLDNMIEMFEKAGMFTTSSKRNLKTGITFIRKFLDETYNNLDQTTQKRLDKKTNTFNISYVDKYTAEKIERDINNKTKFAVIDRELFNDIIEDIAEVRCVNCHKNYEECELYKVLEDSLTPAEGNGNCPFSAEI